MRDRVAGRAGTALAVAVLIGLGSTGSAYAATVVADDQVVQGSQCVGVDCTGTESFGFDTVRLKENNLRMHFDDTSATAAFPANDWRFVFNDNSNAGESYFALEDATADRQSFRVDAGAPSNALRVASSGNVGIGTAQPGKQLSLSLGDTPTIRMEQNGAAGRTPQTWDLGANETS